MEKPCWKDVLLHQLHTLTILDVVVDTRVLSLIKTLLAVSPSLKKIFFHFSNVKADAYAEMSKIKKLFRQCPRKSLSAKIYLSFQNPRNIVTQPNRYSSHLGALWFELHWLQTSACMRIKILIINSGLEYRYLASLPVIVSSQKSSNADQPWLCNPAFRTC